MSNRILTEKVRSGVLAHGMDLVGFAPVSRWKNAPFLLSPPAILPDAQTVVVCAIHITDTWTEMGGEPDPQCLGPGGGTALNSLLDQVGYRTVRRLNDNGHKAIGVVSSNIWRYRKFEGIPSLFAPDLSHIHAATAAGLAEIGWSGLAITPEFGPRCRFISIVTDAELTPTPMYDGPKLCDMCMDCVKHCPSYALKKELGKPREVEIGGKTFRYANKNIWRCAWAEHFNLDLDSDTLEKEEHINEKVIMDEMLAKGVRGHERGVCQKVCIPPHLRTDKPSFGRDNKKIAQNRINKRYPDSMPTLRKMRDDLNAYATQIGADFMSVAPLDEATEAGKIAIKGTPEIKTVIAFAIQIPEAFQRPELSDESKMIYGYTYGHKMHHLLLKMTRKIEDLGYSAASYTGDWTNSVKCGMDEASGTVTIPQLGEYNVSHQSKFGPGAQEYGMAEMLAAMTSLGEINSDGRFNTAEFGPNVIVGAITTDAPIDPEIDDTAATCAKPSARLEGMELRRKLESIAENNLVSAFGAADSSVFKHTADDLKKAVDEKELGESIIDGAKLTYHGPFQSKIIREDKKLQSPDDVLSGAKSVIVLGMHFPMELINNSGLEDTQQIGTYAFHQYQTCFELRFAATELADCLSKMGYRVAISENMLGIGSLVNTPRGLLPDARCNALEGLAAGLGEIGKSGALLTEKYGPHQRRIVLVTNAELPADGVYQGKQLCRDCGECVSQCPMQAFEEKTVPVRIADIEVAYPVVERHRCDWSKRYSLCSEEGPALLGNTTNVEAPERKITIEDLAEACNEKDPVMKSRTCILETCLRQCSAIK